MMKNTKTNWKLFDKYISTELLFNQKRFIKKIYFSRILKKYSRKILFTYIYFIKIVKLIWHFHDLKYILSHSFNKNTMLEDKSKKNFFKTNFYTSVFIKKKAFCQNNYTDESIYIRNNSIEPIINNDTDELTIFNENLLEDRYVVFVSQYLYTFNFKK